MATKHPYQRYFKASEEGELVVVDQSAKVCSDNSIDYSSCNLVSCSHLGYNEKGEVVLIDEPSLDGWQEMNAYAPGSTLKEIIISATRAHGTNFMDSPLLHTVPVSYGDDSIIPDNIFDAMEKRNKNASVLLDLDIVSGSTVEEITKKLLDNPDLIKDFVKSKIENNGGSNNG